MSPWLSLKLFILVEKYGKANVDWPKELASRVARETFVETPEVTSYLYQLGRHIYTNSFVTLFSQRFLLNSISKQCLLFSSFLCTQKKLAFNMQLVILTFVMYIKLHLTLTSQAAANPHQTL